MDPFVQFLTSPAKMTTTTFLNHYKHLILLSEPAPNHLDMVLNHFMVTAISLNKHTALTSQHEYLSIDVYDSYSHQSHLVFLEQMSSSEFSWDLADSASTNNLYHEFICCFISSLPLVASSPSGHGSANQDNQEVIPLLPISQSSDSSHALPPPGQKQAGDQFVIGQPSQLYGGGQIIQQLKPHNLTFFQLITLAETVHNHDSLYTLFRQQCYWYANTIYCVIEQSHTFSERVLHEPENPKYQSSDLCIPPNIYLPSAGRWRGLLVTAVSQDIVEVVRKKFEDCFSESVVHIKGQWDKVHSGNREIENLQAQISQLENELGW
jgi:hypothetical protein